MKTQSRLLICLLLPLCLLYANTGRSEVSPALISSNSQQVSDVGENLGLQVAAGMNKRYLDTHLNCSNDADPAFMCTGVLFRGTRQGNYHVWNNSPLSIKKGGVSFSYLREDVNFSKLAYGYTNGFVFMAGNDARSIKTYPDVLCSFPVDGHTNDRAGTGCGPSPGKPKSNLCRIEKIFTASQWLQAYGSIPNAQMAKSQCGFDVGGAQDSPAGPAFTASLLARLGLGEAGYQMHNEILMRTWPENFGANLPLEAFFYIEGSAAGLAEARHNQRDLKSTDNVTVPIIKIKLPTSELRPVWTINAPATFEYAGEDQAIPIPGNSLVVDQSQMLLNGLAVYVNWPLSGADAPGNTAVRTVTGGRAPYTYTSSNPAIVSVTPVGRVQGRANGIARIIVRDADNSSISYEVKVENVYLLKLSPTKFNLSNAVNWIIANGGTQDSNLIGELVRRMTVMYKMPVPSNGYGWLDRRGRYHGFVRPDGSIVGKLGASDLFFAWAFIPKKP